MAERKFLEENEVSKDQLLCGECSFSTDSVIGFLQHKTQHAGQGCELCLVSFSRQAALKEHYRRKHQIDFDVNLKRARRKGNVLNNKYPQCALKVAKTKQASNVPGCLPSSTLLIDEQTITSTADIHVFNGGKAVVVDTINSRNYFRSSRPDERSLNTPKLPSDKSVINPKHHYSSSVTTVSDNISHITTLPDNTGNITTLSGNTGTITTIPDNIGHIRTVQVETVLTPSEHVNGLNIQTENDAKHTTSSNDVVDQLDKVFIVSVRKEGGKQIVVFDSPAEEMTSYGKTQLDEAGTNLKESSIHLFETGMNLMETGTHLKETDTNLEETGKSLTETGTGMDETGINPDETGMNLAAEENVSLEKNCNRISKSSDDNIQKDSEGNIGDEMDYDENDQNHNSEMKKKTTSSSLVIPKYNAISFGKRRRLAPIKGKIPMELNMSDFFFEHRVLNIGKNQDKISRDQFSCIYCSNKFQSRMLICRHMRECHPDVLLSGEALIKPFKDNMCDGEVMKMTDFINIELNARAPKRVRGVETQDMPGQFPCQFCGKIFERLRYLRVHYKYHTAEKLYLCSICSKTFKTKGNLDQHVKTHDTREPYKCPQCDFESKVNIAIHKHRQIHNSGCQICEVCGKGYKDKSTLTKHKQVHDPSRPFACTYPECTWRFRTEVSCHAHIRLHTAKRSFECELCGYAFRQKHHLQRHEQAVHNKIPEKRYSYFAYKDDSFHGNEFKSIENQKAIDEEQEMSSEVSLTVNDEHLSNVISSEHFDLDNAIQSGQLVIAANDGNINYEMFDIGSNIVYQTVVPEGQQYDVHTVDDVHTVANVHTVDNVQLSYEQEETVQTEVSIEKS